MNCPPEPASPSYRSEVAPAVAISSITSSALAPVEHDIGVIPNVMFAVLVTSVPPANTLNLSGIADPPLAAFQAAPVHRLFGAGMPDAAGTNMLLATPTG